MAPADEQLLRASIRLGRAGLCLMADLAEDALEDASAAWAAVQREAAVVPADQAEVLALLDTMSNSALSRMAHAKAALGRRAALADLAALPAAFKCGAGGAEAAWHLVMQSFDPADGGKEASQDVEDVDVDMVAVTRCARLLSEVVEEASAPENPREQGTLAAGRRPRRVSVPPARGALTVAALARRLAPSRGAKRGGRCGLVGCAAADGGAVGRGVLAQAAHGLQSAGGGRGGGAARLECLAAAAVGACFPKAGDLGVSRRAAA